MLSAPEFSSLIVSRRTSRARLIARGRMLALSAALYALGLAALIVAPFFVLEVVDPPKAVPIFIVDPPLHGGNTRLPAGHIQKGSRDGGAKERSQAPRKKPPARPTTARPADLPAPPPQDFNEADAGPTGRTDPRLPYGDPEGDGDDPIGTSDGCDDCPDISPDGPGDPNAPYAEATVGLVPPALIAGSRALPKYPDLARRAGLQGTVILLAVIEKDGTVGTIEVVRNPDQRWGFDLMAIDAVKQWRYQPALMNGRPVAAYITVMVEFTLAR